MNTLTLNIPTVASKFNRCEQKANKSRIQLLHFKRPVLLAMKLPNITIHQLLVQVLNLAMVLTTSYMFYKGLSVVANSPSPIVVVLSGSMEPAFQRGDILFLWNRDHRVKVGDIVVYNVKERPIPIVHRVLRSHASYVYPFSFLSFIFILTVIFS